MNGRNIMRGAIFSLAITTLPMQLWSAAGCAADAVGKTEDIGVSPSLTGEIQFMLLRLGMEPGPIDGVIGPQTIKALHKFEERAGLPIAALVSGGRVSQILVARLRSDASRAIFESEKRPESPPAAA